MIEKKVPSTDKIHELSGRIYLPESKPKGYFHVVHGMTEHIARYDGFMKEMAKAGYICFGYDNLGHGQTARNKAELGYFSEENGWLYLSGDVFRFADAVRREYGDLPYTLMGHSMGSFIVRTATLFFGMPERLIVMGTGGPNPAAKAGTVTAKAAERLHGGHYVSRPIDLLAFGSYRRHFHEDDPNAWLTKDREVRRAYAEDPYCTFPFTVSAMRDLVMLNRMANSNEWFETVNKKMPILLISGVDDPVGNYGKGVCEVYRRLIRHGANAQIKLYADCRHEILNDTYREEVIEDILRFIGERRKEETV